MKLNSRKVRDFSESLKSEFCIILGNNGTGKTRTLTEKYNAYEKSKNIISDTYPIAGKLFARILKEREILEELTKKELAPKDLEHVNIMLGKNYISVSYIAYSISEIVEEYLGESEDSYKDIFGNLFDGETLEAKDSYYYYIEVKNSDDLEYDILSMGVGESQLLAYYIAFTQRKDTHFFIDEPFNYVSVKSAENFVKLLVYSASCMCNKFTFTTNALEIIDYLKFYKCPIAFLYNASVGETIPVDDNDYFEIFKNRYTFYEERKKIIYVEDNLVKQLLEILLPGFSIEYIGGAGALTTLAKSNKLLNDNDKKLTQKYYKLICLVFDGDQENVLNSSLKEQHFVFFLPFDDVEKTICKNIKEEKNLHVLNEKLTDITVKEIKEIARSNETHDAYCKIKTQLSINDIRMLNYIISIYNSELNKMCESIKGLLN